MQIIDKLQTNMPVESLCVNHFLTLDMVKVVLGAMTNIFHNDMLLFHPISKLGILISLAEYLNQ